MSPEHHNGPASAPHHPRAWLLGIALLLSAAGCSSEKGHQDQNYGNDMGANYQLPDGGPRDSAAVEVTGDVRADATPDAATEPEVDAGAAGDTGGG